MAAEALIPTSADEAVSLFGEGKDLTVFGGGTILLPEMASGRLNNAACAPPVCNASTSAA